MGDQNIFAFGVTMIQAAGIQALQQRAQLIGEHFFLIGGQGAGACLEPLSYGERFVQTGADYTALNRNASAVDFDETQRLRGRDAEGLHGSGCSPETPCRGAAEQVLDSFRKRGEAILFDDYIVSQEPGAHDLGSAVFLDGC